ncbi:glycosyltransferase [Rhodococcus sp. C26F]
MSTRRVGFLIPRLKEGGAEYVAREWATWLSEHGDIVDVILTDAGADVEDVGNAGFTVQRLTSNGWFRKSLELRSLAKHRKYDVVVGLMPYWNLMALSLKALRGAQKPVVIISNRNSETTLRNVLSIKYRVLTSASRVFYRFADSAIAISHPIAAEMTARYAVPQSKIWVVPNPATAKVSRSSEQSRADGGKERTDAVVNIVVPARLVSQKRPMLALETARALAGSLHAEVHYFGSGPLRDAVARRAEELGVAAHFHGWVDAWYAELPENAVVVLPSVAEGLANVLIEAAAVGVPSVASSRALGVADAIVPGVTGCLIPDDSPSSFARGVKEALKCEPSLAAAWLEQYSIEHSGSRLLEVLDTAMAHRTSYLP